MNVKDKLFSKEQVNCTKQDYELRLREEMISYRDRCKDLGDQERLDHAEAEIKRLDVMFDLKIQ